MLSWTRYANAYLSNNDTSGAGSAAGTHFLDPSLPTSHGDVGPEDPQGNLESRPQTRGSPAEETALLQQLPHIHHHQHSRHSPQPRSQSRALHLCFASQPLPFYGTFDSINDLEQHGNAIRKPSHACSVDGPAPLGRQHNTGTGAAASDKRSGCEPQSAPREQNRLPGIARPVPVATASRRPPPGSGLRSGECEKRAPGGPLVRDGKRTPYPSRRVESGETFTPATQSCSTLDGAEDEIQTRAGGKKGGDLTLTSVREKIAALEARAGQHPADVPIVFPLRYKRFVRRTSSTATAARPQTPLYSSKPANDAIIHAPEPTRSLVYPATLSHARAPAPALSPSTSPIPTAATPVATSTSSSKRKKFTLAPPTGDGSDRLTAASFLHGTRNNCVRHGRRAHQQVAGGARDMLDKSRSGAYIPTGLPARRQMEATSPWVVADRSLTSTAGSDACPDCVTELRIKRREINGPNLEDGRRLGERGTQMYGSGVPSSPSPNVQSSETTSTRTAGFSGGSNEDGLIVTRRLKDDLDAIVVEQGGELRHIIISSALHYPISTTLHRLSRELANVSASMASINAHSLSGPEAGKSKGKKCAIAMATSSSSTQSSVPELLDMIDQATSEIHSHAEKTTEEHIVKPYGEFEAPLSPEELKDHFMSKRPSPTQGLVGRQCIDEQHRRMHDLLNTSAPRKPSIPAGGGATASSSQAAPVSNVASTPGAPQDKPDPKVPIIKRTRPTLPSLPAVVDPKAAAQQEPTPSHPSLHHAIALTDPPTSTAPAFPTPKPADEHEHPTSGSFFHNFLNPFHPRPKTPTTPSAQSQAQQSLFTTTPSSPLSPLSPAPPPLAGSQNPDIRTQPSPYHHAPASPPDLGYAKWVDTKVVEGQSVIRKAMRMEKERIEHGYEHEMGGI
ncbi:hypothetical protein BDY17DRAFT_295034 [Neohortaea acidophila]|uniref:Uncharacterized protein n=1 Tax=Neohortaea acidophila TaxID=245834 RepID=A0A6A6PXB3_9PEZI|nr:uncharacterized protein BDY17DRAFT_295034 [Neohortaea acidophila]KAF2484133.1 hypothetical protein BDY17DRAFT_295034 [Neohortaea acidophila]